MKAIGWIAMIVMLLGGPGIAQAPPRPGSIIGMGNFSHIVAISTARFRSTARGSDWSRPRRPHPSRPTWRS